MEKEERRMQTEETSSDKEMELVRMKIMKARERLGTSLMDIPTGREYDSPPEKSDELVHKTLKKTCKTTLLVHPTVKAEEDSVVRHEDKLGILTGVNVAFCQSEENDKCAPQVGTLKGMCLSTIKQNLGSNDQKETKHHHSISSVIVNADICTASPLTQLVVSPTAIPVDSGLEGKQLTGGDEKQIKASASFSAQSATNATPPQSPMSAPNRTSSEDGFVSTPEAKREPRDKVMKSEIIEEARTKRADHIFLNEFLIAELEAYCFRLLRRECSNNGSSDVSDLARITGLQLYQDHQRALMDFDDEWKRSHADSYRDYLPPTSNEPTVAPANARTNPFQLDPAITTGVGGWTALVNQVRASSMKSNLAEALPSPEVNVQEGIEDLFVAYKQGSNGIVVGGDNFHKERLQVSAFLAQIASSQNTSAFHIIVAAGSDLAQWEKALSSERLIQSYPYWGSKQDRQNLLQLLSNEYFSSQNLSTHVLLTSYEVFMEDILVVTSLQCQLSIIDIPRQATDQIATIWSQLLSLRCRQRLLLCQPGFEIDARRLLHFLVPELFSSRRKLLAWNGAAFHNDQVCAICGMVKAFMVISNEKACAAFLSMVESYTMQNCEGEMATLNMLNRQGIVRAIQPSIMMPVKRVLGKKTRNRASGHIPAKGKMELQQGAFGPVDSQLTINAPNNYLKKRSGNDGTPGSRQRIGRCGKCAGCLAEDCMKCGHCQDMKKYGGPGLRKQSCKYRKCLNPKIWGLASRKRKRKTKRVGGISSVKVSELDDEGFVAYSSAESDGESVSTATYGNGGSDDESFRYSDVTVDSPRDLLLPTSDTLLDDHLSLSDLSSRSVSARSRVVRCGECQGCHAPDCMKCPHCLDMKKYGGPGLRKQTCKNRKCNAPKTVMLNQAKGGHAQYVDEIGNVVYTGLNDSTFPGFYEAPDSSDRLEATTKSLGIESQSGVLSVAHELERYVKPRLAFVCMDCAARFSSSKVLTFHVKVEHSSSAEHILLPSALEQEANRLFKRPSYQNAMISAQLKQQDEKSYSSPLGYAKLEGENFQFYVIDPLVILGRMSSQWCQLYENLGFKTLKGLAGDNVDCHIENDSAIPAQHAVISWDAGLGSFVIECLSLQTPIFVNGREISFSSLPVVLSSKNLVQIGMSSFYFLLPKTMKTKSAIEETS
ncbi:unnamed protein product [Peronospora effusa]|uniref:CXXC-type domain-containing protein n=1 Tax=Peronospora effusa TaxID=542832 RepID=A0A3M6VGT5_9STRA|nr:hypothetical protein DD238_001780 [Peronospora effusa]RQM14179.1 hypothetical protein DD237_003484 [Peronospora effusa]CAI5704658.1 unnamed protein product [Peronospora effusa]